MCQIFLLVLQPKLSALIDAVSVNLVLQIYVNVILLNLPRRLGSFPTQSTATWSTGPAVTSSTQTARTTIRGPLSRARRGQSLTTS